MSVKLVRGKTETGGGEEEGGDTPPVRVEADLFIPWFSKGTTSQHLQLLSPKEKKASFEENSAHWNKARTLRRRRICALEHLDDSEKLTSCLQGFSRT